MYATGDARRPRKIVGGFSKRLPPDPSNRSAINVASRWMIANIASDDALILAHRANPAGLNFRERQGWRNRPGASAAMYSSTSVLPDQSAEGRTESGPALRNLGNGT